MNEDFLKPYKKLQAIEEQLEFDSLLHAYQDLYKRKFKAEPIFPVSNLHLTQIKQFKKMAGAKAHAILNAYFRMNDDWFMKQSYSIDCLIKNLNRVHVESLNQTKIFSKAGQISLKFNCDSCWKEFEFNCDPNFNYLIETVRCGDCESDKKPVKTVPKKDRKATIIKMGRAFKSL